MPHDIVLLLIGAASGVVVAFFGAALSYVATRSTQAAQHKHDIEMQTKQIAADIAAVTAEEPRRTKREQLAPVYEALDDLERYLAFRIAERGFETVTYDALPDHMKEIATSDQYELAMAQHRREVLASFGDTHVLPLAIRTSLVSLRAAKAPALSASIILLTQLISSNELDLVAIGRALIDTRETLNAYAVKANT